MEFVSCEIHHLISSLKKFAKVWVSHNLNPSWLPSTNQNDSWFKNQSFYVKKNSLKKWWSFGEKIALRRFIVQIVGNHPNQLLGPCCARTRVSGNPNIVFACFEIVEMFGVFLKCSGEKVFLWADLDESIFFTWIKSRTVITSSKMISVSTKSYLSLIIDDW